jgi:hypothetical protein
MGRYLSGDDAIAEGSVEWCRMAPLRFLQEKPTKMLNEPAAQVTEADHR